MRVRSKWCAVLVTATVVAGALAAAPAGAAPPAGPTLVDSVTGATGAQARAGAAQFQQGVARTATGRAVDGPAAAAEVLRYWTPERMRAAETADTGVLAATPFPTSRTIGKVFFVDPNRGNRDSACSAAVLHTAKGKLVLTAGHCVHGGGTGRQYMTQWMFSPGHNGGDPVGRFTAVAFTTYTLWLTNGNSGYDVAVAELLPLGGASVVAAVGGGNGLAINYGVGHPVTAVGYPALGGFATNKVQQACAGTTFQFGPLQVGISNCDFTGGASGGPWFLTYNQATGSGHIYSVSGNILDRVLPGEVFGAYFDDTTYAMVSYAEYYSA
ncbi:hypothetical protein WEI85_43740 [Actinomycetes bacterium KLBMP 9797]